MNPPPGNDTELLDETIVAELETLAADGLNGLLRLYFDESATQLTELTGAVNRADTIAVGAAAHRIVGSSRALGASHVSHIASKLEATARVGDLTTADALIAQLTGALGDTREAFATRVR